MPLQATSGAASYDAFGGGVPVVPNYIEEVFSCFLHTGNGTSQTITNGIDLSTKGGLVWVKSRSLLTDYGLADTVRGRSSYLFSNDTAAAQTSTAGTDISSFNSNGFSIGTNYNININNNGATFVSWTFREQPKFFDVLTYTGTGSNTTIAHSLGSVPGCIMVKRTDTTGDWQVYHRSLANTEYLVLNSEAAKATGATRWNSTTPTSTVFSLGTDATVNASAGTYVAYVFAHDAGGFGLTGTDNVISCGTFTGAGATTPVAVNIGFEPQWMLVKQTSGTGSWSIVDNMRGFVATTNGNVLLYPNTSTSGDDTGNYIPGQPTATGFNGLRASGQTFIYIAIRRGPMKVPTVGTSVYKALTRTGTGSADTVTGVGFTPDLVMGQARTRANGTTFKDRLRGSTVHLYPSSTNAEGTGDSTAITSFDMNGISLGTDAVTGSFNESGTDYVTQFFKRAPSFFDEVCYKGTATAGQTFNHNLGVVPQLMIIKKRSSTASWPVYLSATTLAYLDLTDSLYTSSSHWNNTAPTSTVFTLGTSNELNESGQTYVNYLFATCAGVSKVGSYTGNGSTQTIDCGFGASGARFVLIKRTDSTGGWYVYDTARGMTVLTDPYLFLNTSAAESATLGSVTTVSTGFALNSTILAAINVSAGTYIFLAIA